MRPKIISSLLFIFCFGFLTCCGIFDEDDDYFNGKMQAKVNDELIIFDEAYGERVLTWYWEWTDIQSIVGITNKNITGVKINISSSCLYNPVGTNSHPHCSYALLMGNSDDNNLNTYYSTKDLPRTSQGSQFSSTVVLTSYTNKRIKGTFSFTAYDDVQNPTDSVIVTDGKFEIDSDGKKW